MLVRPGEEVRDDPVMAAIPCNNTRDICERECRGDFEERIAEGFERHLQFGTAVLSDP